MDFNVRIHNRCNKKIYILNVKIVDLGEVSEEFCGSSSECCPPEGAPVGYDASSHFTVISHPKEIDANSSGTVSIHLDTMGLETEDYASAWLYVFGRDWKTGSCIKGPWARKELSVYIRKC